MGGDELNLVIKAFESNYIAPVGPMVDAFERAFAKHIGFEHAVALSSGTAAIHLALRNLEIAPGDEVFASTLTFIGSVSPIVFLGARPVFIDCDRSTWNMDPELLHMELERCRKFRQLPKAVIPTDLYGQSVDLDRILAICAPYGVPVVTDTAESLGATVNGRHAGVGAKAAAFSFNGNKIITSSGGGMLCSSDADFIEKAKFLSQQAKDDAPHYEHSSIGYNYRMSNIVAAIGLGQLKCLDRRIVRKREIFDLYQKILGDLPGITFMPEADYGHSTRWLSVMLVDPVEFGADRETVRLTLEKENIESRPVWKPMHQQPVFSGNYHSGAAHPSTGPFSHWPARKIGGAVADELFAKGLCLPSGTAMTNSDIERVAGIIRQVFSQQRKR